MLRTALIRIAYCATIFFALCAGAAYGQDHPKSLREVLEGYPGWMVMPVQRFPHIPQTQQTPPTPQKTVLRNENRGRIDVQWLRFQLLAQSGDEVEIRGFCPSALYADHRPYPAGAALHRPERPPRLPYGSI
jgi:hypothetical protein